jgi:hypothetical protein
MVELEEVIKFVKKIRDDGLETASMKEVAQKMGYAAPTSTPFYRRMVAARLFGLISKSGPDLTAQATAYLKPDDEDAAVNALVASIRGIPAYAEAVQKYDGKKLNLELIANGFETKLKVTNVGAKICAKVFEQSMRFAGFLAADGIVKVQPSSQVSNKPIATSDDPHASVAQAENNGNGPQTETQTHTLYLNKNKLRKFTVTAPLDLDQSELDRITGWLGFTFLVEQPPKPTTTSKAKEVIG